MSTKPTFPTAAAFLAQLDADEAHRTAARAARRAAEAEANQRAARQLAADLAAEQRLRESGARAFAAFWDDTQAVD